MENQIIQEVRTILADAEAKNVDALTLAAAERLLEAIRTLVAQDAVLHGGRTEWARDWNVY